MKRKRLFDTLIALFSALYFLILFAERTQSVARVIADGGFFASGFDIFVDLLAVCSLTATLVLLVGFNKDLWLCLFGKGGGINYTRLSLTAGVLLLSGMVHTEHTVALIQFAAYGCLIAALILRTVESSCESGNRFKLWYSLLYLTVFSMAIPVMYRTGIGLSVLFHILEAVTAILLVFFFTLLMRRVFIGKAENLLAILPFIIMAAADCAILALRWQEEVNTFVLIFAIASAVLFFAGRIIFAIIDR